MTQTEFYTACLERTIDPAIALEDEAVIEALQRRDITAVLAALDNNF